MKKIRKEWVAPTLEILATTSLRSGGSVSVHENTGVPGGRPGMFNGKATQVFHTPGNRNTWFYVSDAMS